ncbi:hypothetical protein SLEP1_g16348 [Rubroshorea leprosula]|uniref:glutathione transferase n=1 Tax=Rubroshorea leprosula TaxID=152421 RepID=A0AAV5IWJ5_9ROSI|nr:hypothetical protein SLEP1_g16348 [Rubroshorea leprosula]
MDKEVILLDLQPSPFAMRVKIALAEKGVEFKSKEEDLSNKSPLLLEMNPVNKQVPVLIHKGRPICESLIIVQYIDEIWNHKSPLLPSDPHQRAHARFWAAYVDKIYTIGRSFWTSEGKSEETTKDLLECFKTLEGELGDKPYFGDKTMNIVDISLIPFSTFFYTLEKFGNFSMKAECPKLVAWANRCMQKESVSKSLCDPFKTYEVVMQIRKRHGIK